jgi:hypothetical protein
MADNLKTIKIEYSTFKVNGAGEIKMGNLLSTCKNQLGIHIGVSWGKHGFIGGSIPKDEALKMALHIIKMFNSQIQITINTGGGFVNNSMDIINPWVDINDRTNKIPNDLAIKIEILFADGVIKDFEDHHHFEIITHWRLKK